MAVLTMNPVSENLSLAEPGTTSLPWSRSLTPEKVGGSTSATRVSDVYRSLAESLGVSEATARSLIWSRILSETGGFSTAYSLALAWGRSVSENLSFDCDRSGLDHGTLGTSLGAWWNLDEASGDRIDSSGNGNTLSSTNGVASTVGRNGDAATFVSASNQHLDVTDNTTINMASRDWSVALWVKFDALTNDEPNDYVGICSKGDGTNDGWGMCIFYRPSLDRIELKISDGSPGTGVSGYSLRANTFGGLSTGTWYFIVATFDYDTMTATISVNGTEDSGTSSYVVYDPAGAGAFSLGRAFNVNRYNMSGAIDGVGIWSKVLSSTEKSDLYNSGAGISRPTSENSPSLVTDYRRSIQESLALSEMIRRTTDVYRSVADTVGASTAAGLGQVFGTSVAETLGLSTSGPGFGFVFRRELTDRFGLSTSTTAEKRSPVTMSVVSSTVGASTAAAAGAVYARRLSETVRLSNSVSRAVDYLRFIADPSLGMSDAAPTWDKDHSLSVSETLGLSDSPTLTFFNPGLAIMVTDSLSLSDSLTGSLTLTPFAITVADQLGLSTYSIATAYGVAWTISVNDTVGLSTDAAREVTVARLLSDTAGITTTVVFQQDANRVMVEQLGLSTAASHAAIIQRLLADSLGATDATAKSVAYGRLLTDTLALSQSISRQVGVLRAVSDTVGISESVGRIVDVARRLSESLGVATTPTTQIDYLRSLAESLGVSDLASRGGAVWGRTVSDTVGASGSLSSIRTIWARLVAEQVSISDEALFGTILPLLLIDTLGLSDAADLAVVWRRAVSDPFGISTDAVQGNNILQRQVFDALGVEDLSESLAAIWSRSVSDQFSVSDSIRRQVDYRRMLSDALGVSDHADAFNTTGECRTVASGVFIPGQAASDVFVPGSSGSQIFVQGGVA